jgi:hypothetical protein
MVWPNGLKKKENQKVLIPMHTLCSSVDAEKLRPTLSLIMFK